MWNRLSTLGSAVKGSISPLLTLQNQNVYQQFRTTFILKRRWPPGLHKKWQTYKAKALKSKHYHYDLVENTVSRKKEPLDVILTKYVAGLGNPGDRLTLKQGHAYNELLLPGLAVYASPENIEKYSHRKTEEHQFSSPYVQDTIRYLAKVPVIVFMNKEVPWTVQPWHVKMSCRKAGIHMPEDAIKLPDEPISGPNMNLEGKFFEATITINNKETATVKCVIQHWDNSSSVKLPVYKNFEKVPLIPIFPEKTETETEV